MQTRLIFIPLTRIKDNQKIWVSISQISVIEPLVDSTMIIFDTYNEVVIETNVIERIKEYASN